MANRGAIVGKVRDANGKIAKGATVAISRITMANGQLLSMSGNAGKLVSDEVGSDGKYALSFSWSGTDFGEDVQNFRVLLAAYYEKDTKSGYSMSNFTRYEVPGYLRRDIVGLAKNFVTDLSSREGVADYANDIANALGGWEGSFGFVKDVNNLSTEQWLIVSIANLWLKAS